jgi:uncharacterized damage-inducible protein DinB
LTAFANPGGGIRKRRQAGRGTLRDMDPRPLLIDTVAFLSPGAALDGLAADVAGRRVTGTTHSIAEVVAHLAFWQDWFCGRCDGTGGPMPASAAAGWPAADAGDWEALRRRFLDGLERLATIGAAGDPRRRIDPPIEFAPMAALTLEEAVVHVATHNAHHLGQIVLLRQLLGAWPPPAGSYTW